jgi:Phage portal protein
MPKGGAVLAGLASQGGQAGPTLQPATGAISPLAAQYAQWTLGRTPVNVALPRDPMEFLTGAFGPLMPITPVGIDEPGPGQDRPEPRRWQYPVGWNMPMGMPGTEGLKLADFQTLRLYADLYSVARACIQLRKDEVLGIGWDIGPTDDAAKAMRGDAKAMADFGARRAEAVKFFQRPDPNYTDFTSWFDAILEDMFVIDAIAIYLHPSRLPGKGLFGTSLGGLDVLDGSLIRPLVDLRGSRPAPPNPAFQWYEYGIPRVDLMSMLSQQDVKELGPPVKQYAGDQLMYLVRNPRTWTVYGQAPIERCVIPVITGLRKQQWAMDFFQEGSIPGVYISPGDANMTPNQIREIQDALNAIAGDIAYKHKVIMLPANSRVDPQKPPDLADQSDEVIMTQVTMAFGVMPMELGISPRVSATQSTGAANQMAKMSQDVQERKALKPDLLWFKSALFDRILQDLCGQKDMEWKWDGLEEDQDLDTLTNLLVTQIGAGLSSIDEARIEMGRLPWGLPITSDPGWASPTAGFTPLGQISALGAPEANVAPPPPPGAPPAPGGGAPGGNFGSAPPGGTAPSSAGEAPGNAGQSPAHAAQEAGAAAAFAKPKPTAKAVASELDALRRHLGKGREITTWEARYVPERTLSKISESLAKGLSPEQAVGIEMSLLPIDVQPDLYKVGQEGYIHNWICVRPPCGKVGDKIVHPVHGAGIITARDHDGRLHAKFEDNKEGVLGKQRTQLLGPKVKPTGVAPSLPSAPGKKKIVLDQARLDEIDRLIASGKGSEYTPRQMHTPHLQDVQHETEMRLLTAALTKQPEALKREMKKGLDEIHEMRDALEDAHLDHATRSKLLWHAGAILGGFIGALALTVATGGGFLPLAILMLGTAPGFAQEYIDFRREW